MDESYLEWLIGLPGFGEAKARRVAERFPSLEQLRAATREELTSVPGVTSADLETLLGLLSDGSERDASGELFLCPECGSFVGTAAKSCPFCGVGFERGREGFPDARAAEGRGRPAPLGGGRAPRGARALRPPHRGRRHVGAGLGEPGENPREARPSGGSRRLALEGRGPEPDERRRISSRGPEHPSLDRRYVGPPCTLAAAGRHCRAKGRRHAARRGAQPLRLLASRGPFLGCRLAHER